jgi:lysophospholipid acyltransferase (LPLAT)-like uncharacterized protein
MSGHLWQANDRELTGARLWRLRLQGWLGWLMLNLLGKSWRLDEDLQKMALIRKGSPISAVILVFWHNRLLTVTVNQRHRGVHALRSSSRDGQLIANILRRFGFGTPAGSSSREGAAGLRKVVRAAMEGHDVAITVDGPKGPRGRFKAGAIQVAALSGCPIVPVITSANRAIRIRNWDRTTIPAPFSRVRIRYGDPVYVQKKMGAEPLELLRRSLETTMQELTDNLDREMNSPLIPPDRERSSVNDSSSEGET